MKTFILLCAIPGSGKSSWAEQYRLTHDNVYIVSSDGLRKELTGEYQNFTREVDVWRLFLERCNSYKDLADDVTVIADSTNCANIHRKLYGEKVTGYDKKILLEIKRPLEVALEQNKLRNPNRIVPPEVVKRMYDNYEEPTPEVLALYDEHVIIDNFNINKVNKDFHYKP